MHSTRARAPLHVAVAVAIFAAVASGLAMPACTTGAVGVEACQQIETARCTWAQNCGISLTDPPHHGAPATNIDYCIQFYRDQCFHGLATSVTPSSSQVSACVDAINTGNCDYVTNPQDSPACAFLIPPDTDAGTTTTDASDAESDATED